MVHLATTQHPRPERLPASATASFHRPKATTSPHPTPVIRSSPKRSVWPRQTPKPVAKPTHLPTGSVPARIAKAWPGTNDGEAVAVAACESGFNPAARSGPYLGLFQADASFRRAYSYGPSVEQQTMMAWRGYQARGWQPWPVCGKRRFGPR